MKKAYILITQIFTETNFSDLTFDDDFIEEQIFWTESLKPDGSLRPI